MQKFPYKKKYRLADVLALIQVLAMYKETYRTEEGVREEFQEGPQSAKSWIQVAKEHQEFFRVRKEKGTEISLIARHAKKDHAGLDPEHASRLMETAIKIHDSQLNSSRSWTFWMPVVGAFLGALLAKFFTR